MISVMSVADVFQLMLAQCTGIIACLPLQSVVQLRASKDQLIIRIDNIPKVVGRLLRLSLDPGTLAATAAAASRGAGSGVLPPRPRIAAKALGLRSGVDGGACGNSETEGGDIIRRAAGGAGRAASGVVVGSDVGKALVTGVEGGARMPSSSIAALSLRCSISTPCPTVSVAIMLIQSQQLRLCTSVVHRIESTYGKVWQGMARQTGLTRTATQSTWLVI
jgi:hypothetical protein